MSSYENRPNTRELWEYGPPGYTRGGGEEAGYVSTYRRPFEVLLRLLELGEFASVDDRHEDLPHDEEREPDEEDAEDDEEDDRPNLHRLLALCGGAKTRRDD